MTGHTKWQTIKQRRASQPHFGWKGCDAYCEHGGLCMLQPGKHDIHDTGTHPFSEPYGEPEQQQ